MCCILQFLSLVRSLWSTLHFTAKLTFEFPDHTGSQVLQRSPTSPESACPRCGFGPLRTGLDPAWAETPRRSPGSRAYCFSACRGSQTTQGRPITRDLSQPAVLPSPSEIGFDALIRVFRSSIARPTDTPIYASASTSRCLLQDSGPRWIRFSFLVGLFHSLQHAGLSRRTPGNPVNRPKLPVRIAHHAHDGRSKVRLSGGGCRAPQ
jgi:hypothetical protein